MHIHLTLQEHGAAVMLVLWGVHMLVIGNFTDPAYVGGAMIILGCSSLAWNILYVEPVKGAE